MEFTPEMLEQFNANRAAVKANLDIVDASIDELSPAAQGPAKQLRDLIISDEQDIDKLTAEIAAIKGGMSEDVSKELDAHDVKIAKAIGLMQ